MSALSHVELELLQKDADFDRVLDVLLKGCWIEERDCETGLHQNAIQFSGGLHDSFFKVIMDGPLLILESDSPWELEVLTAELKEIAVKKNSLVNT